MTVFDLTELQADLHPRHAAAPADQVLPDRAGEGAGRAAARRSTSSTRSSPTRHLLRRVVSDELAEVAKTFGTPRRTVLLESAGAPVKAAAVALEVADDPCYAFLSSTGLLARSSSRDAIGVGGGRTNHDVVVSVVATTVRGEVGVLTSAGRLVRLGVLDLPAIPASANDPNLQGGLPVSEVLQLGAGEQALALCTLATDGPGPGAGHPAGRGEAGQPRGARPRRLGGDPAGRRRRGGRRRRAAPPAAETLCFVTTDAQLLHFRGRRGPAAGPIRRRHRRDPAGRQHRGVLVRRRRPRRTGRLRGRHRLRVLDRAARHRAGRGQGDARSPSTRPRAGPPAGCAATASSRARTRWSSPGSGPRRPGPPPPAAPRSSCPPPPGAATAPACRAAQPIAACAGPVGGPGSRRCARLAGMTALLHRGSAVAGRTRRTPRSVSLVAALAASAVLTLTACSGAGDEDGRAADPRGGAGHGQDRPSTRPPGCGSRWPPPTCPSGTTGIEAARGGRRPPARLRRHHHRGAGRSGPRGPGDRGRRQGVRRDPVHPRLERHRPRRLRRSRPGRADQHRRRLLLAAAGHHRRSRRARASAAAPTTTRCSPSTPAPCPTPR